MLPCEFNRCKATWSRTFSDTIMIAGLLIRLIGGPNYLPPHEWIATALKEANAPTPFFASIIYLLTGGPCLHPHNTDSMNTDRQSGADRLITVNCQHCTDETWQHFMLSAATTTAVSGIFSFMLIHQPLCVLRHSSTVPHELKRHNNNFLFLFRQLITLCVPPPTTAIKVVRGVSIHLLARQPASRQCSGFVLEYLKLNWRREIVVYTTHVHAVTTNFFLRSVGGWWHEDRWGVLSQQRDACT